MKKRKIVFLLIFLVLAVITAAAIYFSPSRVTTPKPSPVSPRVIVDEPAVSTYTDISGEIAGFYIQYGTYMRTNYGTVNVRLSQNGVVVQDWQTDASTLRDNQYEAYELDKPIKVKKTDQLTAALWSSDFEDGQFVAVWTDGSNPASASFCLFFARINVIHYGQLALSLLIFLVELLLLYRNYDKLCIYIRTQREKAAAEKKIRWRSVLTVAVCALAGALDWLLLYATKAISSASFYTIFYFVDAGVMIGCLIAWRKQLGAKPEKGFFIIALCIGLLFAVLEPIATSLSWDDEIHFNRIIKLTYGENVAFSEAEKYLSVMHPTGEISLPAVLETNETLNGLHTEVSNISYGVNVPLISIPSYLPAAGAIWIARNIGLSFTAMVIAGRAANLLCYCAAVYFAIKQLRRGKLLVASLAMLPSVLFLAGNYSYDPFCIGFILLGICIWLGVYQTPGRYMTFSRAVLMLATFCLGVGTKAVYFPLMVITLFLPASKFRNASERKLYCLAVVMAAVVMLCSFALPFISHASAGTSGDSRGGTGVNGGEQARFILTHPLQYAVILLRFLFKEYFNFDAMMNHVSGCVRAFSYIGGQVIFPSTWAAAYLCLILLVWFGSDSIRQKNIVYLSGSLKWISLVIAFGTICLSATALYCSFTPVANPTINGFQERYMLPVAFPLLLLIQPSFLKNTLKKRRFNALVLFMEAAILLIGMWSLAKLYF
ncbi:MAG: DUF2142 domain-containing protein [Clostridia bacterium]|nr:DUF2142 domain-containing protein [Clostridia bacterium]